MPVSLAPANSSASFEIGDDPNTLRLSSLTITDMLSSIGLATSRTQSDLTVVRPICADPVPRVRQAVAEVWQLEEITVARRSAF